MSNGTSNLPVHLSGSLSATDPVAVIALMKELGQLSGATDIIFQ